jgi:hypothetical protein
VLVHSVEDLPVDEEFIDLAKKNHTILIPTLTVLGGYGRMFHGGRRPEAAGGRRSERLRRRSDDGEGAETASVERSSTWRRVLARARTRRIVEQFSRANLKTLVAAGIPIATGTDAGNPLTLHGPAIYAEMEAMQKPPA